MTCKGVNRALELYEGLAQKRHLSWEQEREELEMTSGPGVYVRPTCRKEGTKDGAWVLVRGQQLGPTLG
jgi:hypothetical protein